MARFSLFTFLDLKDELSATKEKLAKAEAHRLNLLGHVELYAAEMADAKLAGFATAQDLFTSYNAAEKRIRASQEQVPAVYVKFWARQRLCGQEIDCDEGLEVCRKGEHGDDGVLASPLYTMPPIPPEFAELQRENAELKVWKESALSVMPDYQAIGKVLEIKLGDSVHDKILPAIIELKRQNSLNH